MKRFQLLLVLGLTLCFFACNDDDVSETDQMDSMDSMDPIDSGESEFCVSEDEQTLYDAIMVYRVENNRESIAMSFALSKVAQLHAEDLRKNFSSYTEECNLHSWSGDGDWNECCYTADHANAVCMWDKPAEISDYASQGFEISAFGGGGPLQALDLWKESAGHNPLLLNLNGWEQRTWRSIGIGISGSFSVVWFGQIADTEREIEYCP